MKTALVLAGHGSHISPHTAGIIWQQVDRLRAMGVADEITAAFWKETPSFHGVLNTVTADDITIVPLFTAQGYFTRTVIPLEMGLEGAMTVWEERRLRYTHTFGEHPRLSEIIRERVTGALQTLNARREQIGVAIIGHGTKRNPQSRIATETQADLIRDARIVGEVVAVYLDDDPTIATVYERLSTPIIIAVPYFLALGSHTMLDVPQALGLAIGQTQAEVQGRTVYYRPPLGIDVEMILELATDAPLYAAQQGSAWDCFPAGGRDELIDAVMKQGELQFGELILTPSRVYTGDGRETITEVAILRERVRTGGKVFRPLATAKNLPSGWQVLIPSPERLHAVVETVYPGVVAAWAAQHRGDFKAFSFESAMARQQGMFRQLAGFDPNKIVVCEDCICHPTWRDGADDKIPCSEPCNFWLSTALETQE